MHELRACTLFIGLGQTVSDTEVKHMLEEIDTDGNGVIDFDEFTIMMAVSPLQPCSAIALVARH